MIGVGSVLHIYRSCTACHNGSYRIYCRWSGLDLYSTSTDPAQHVITAAIGSTVDYLYVLDNDVDDLYDLDRHLFELCNYYKLFRATRVFNLRRRQKT